MFENKYASLIKNEFGITVKFNLIMSPKKKMRLAHRLYDSLGVLSNDFGLGELVNPSGSLKIVFGKGSPGARGLYKDDTIYLYSPMFSALSHELFHAIDCQCGKLFNIPDKEMLSDYLFVTTLYGNSNEWKVSDEICKLITDNSIDSFKSYFQSMMKRSANYDMHIIKQRYYSLPKEILARGFEAYVYSKTNESLLLFVKDDIEWLKNSSLMEDNYVYPRDSEMPAMAALYESFVCSAKDIGIRTPLKEFQDVTAELNETYIKHKSPLAVQGTKVRKNDFRELEL